MCREFRQDDAVIAFHGRTGTRLLKTRVLLAGLVAVSLCAVVLAEPASATVPTLTTFTPTAGALNQPVTITGSGFIGATAVKFAGVSATFTVTSATSISTAVPASAASGPIAISTPGGTVISATAFAVNPGISPSTTVGPPGTTISLAGSGFAPFEGVDVYVDTVDVVLVGTGASGAFTAAVQIPAAASPGTHWLSASGRHSGRFSQAAFTVRTDWPMRGRDARHSGWNASENTLSPSTVSGLDQAWTYATGGSVYSSPAVVAGIVYAGSYDKKVYALNPTGTVKWSYTTGNWVISSPTVVGGVVYVGSTDGKVYALNAITGALKWSFSADGGIGSSPTVVGGVVYIGSNNNKVYALDAVTGALRWSHAAANTSSPAVVGGVVYLGSADGNVYALNATTGSVKWNYLTGAAVESSPTVVGGVVYVGSDDGSLYALNATTGVLSWSYYTGSIMYTSSPAVVGGVVYIGTYSSFQLLAINARSGALKWADTLGSAAIGAPTVANGVVYVGSDDGDVYAFDTSTSARLWFAATGGTVRTAPVVADGAVTVASADGLIYHYTLAAGAPAAAYRTQPTHAQLHPNAYLRQLPQ